MTPTASTVPVLVPDIGDFGDVPVIELLVSVGDSVAADDPLVTLESEKATMDVPAPVAGVVKAVHVKLGDKVSEGSKVVDLETAEGESGAAASDSGQGSDESETSAEQAESASEQAAVAAAEAGGPTVATHNGGGPVYASPAVRRLARELGIDLHSVSGSGRKGRVTLDDVRAAGTAPAGVPTNGSLAGLGLAPWPVVDFEKFGPVDRVPRSRIQKISAPNLARNWVMIPHVTHNDEADITELEAWRKQLNTEQRERGGQGTGEGDGPVKFTMVTFLIAACVATLKEFPAFNSSLAGDELVLRRYFNIGFAADTPDGLVVPVIRNADTKGLTQIARELTELSGKARAGKLSPAEISGGTFTISSLGGIGGSSFTPIINAPEVAILGVTRSAIKPVWDAETKQFAPRLLLPLSLSYDHRVIDGAAAARFVRHLVGVLADLRRTLL